MPNIYKKDAVPEDDHRIKLTVRLTVTAYDVLSEIQRLHRRQTGKALPIWRVINAAIIAYAEREKLAIEE